MELVGCRPSPRRQPHRLRRIATRVEARRPTRKRLRGQEPLGSTRDPRDGPGARPTERDAATQASAPGRVPPGRPPPRPPTGRRPPAPLLRPALLPPPPLMSLMPPLMSLMPPPGPLVPPPLMPPPAPMAATHARSEATDRTAPSPGSTAYPQAGASRSRRRIRFGVRASQLSIEGVALRFGRYLAALGAETVGFRQSSREQPTLSQNPDWRARAVGGGAWSPPPCWSR
jgi:hypothetical protein